MKEIVTGYTPTIGMDEMCLSNSSSLHSVFIRIRHTAHNGDYSMMLTIDHVSDKKDQDQHVFWWFNPIYGPNWTAADGAPKYTTIKESIEKSFADGWRVYQFADMADLLEHGYKAFREQPKEDHA